MSFSKLIKLKYDRIISWEKLREKASAASSLSPRHRGCVFLSLLVSGLPGTKSPGCSECYNRWASAGPGSRCHMVHRVKAGELCGTIAGLPWHQKNRREGMRSRGVGGGGRLSRDWRWRGGVGGGAEWGGVVGISLPRWWKKSSRGNYYERHQVKLDWHEGVISEL